MDSLNKKYSTGITHKAGRWLLMILIICSRIIATGQNINTTNKIGPLGTEVNTYTGNVFIPRNDVFVPARGLDISITFYYNSYNQDQNLGFGNGWNMSYGIRYKIDSANDRIISWGDGREDLYKILAGGGFKTPTGFFDTLTQYQPNKYLLKQPDGTRYYFDNNIHQKITRLQEPNGNFINFNYTDSLLISLTNTAGQTITFNYDGNGRLISLVDALVAPSRTYSYTYDGSNNLTQVTDPLGGKNKYAYLVNGPMKAISDKNNNTVDIIYYPDLSASELIGCNKRVSFSYDTSTNVTVVTDHVSTGNQVTKYNYQKFGELAWVSSITGNCCGFNLVFEFDANGNKTKQTDANGQVYTYTYDANGNMLTSTDPLSQTTTYTYSSDLNQVTSITDSKGNVYSMQYNANGNLTQLTEPGNNIYLASYNSNGDITSSTDPKGNVYTYSYDAYGNPISVSGPNGYHDNFVNDARGNLLSVTDARNNTATAQYDILNRLKNIKDPSNNATQFNYDAEGNAISVVNKNNETSLLNYDASNRLVKFTDVLGHKTEMSYDGMNNLVSARDALGNGVNYTYDTRNRISGTKDALANSTQNSYDANGNIISRVMPNGQTINYTYDNINRVTGVSDITGTIASITYDKNNNVTDITNGTGALTTATYDSLNRMTKITDPLGFSNSFSYDRNNNITAVTDMNGFARTYVYDSSNRVKSFTDNNGFVVNIVYDAAGNVIQNKDQNNNITAYTYDNLDRIKTITYPDGKFIQYGYDNKSNIISKKLTDGASITYQYDSLNRVIGKTLPGGIVYTYGYDAIDRIVSATNNNGTVAITYDVLDRVSSETYDGRTIHYSYNIAGRTQTTIYPDSTSITKNFDTRNRLISIAKNNINIVSYQYDNNNQVTAKNFANGVGSNMQYDFASRLSGISTASGSIQNTSFTYDNDRNKTAINRLNNPSLSEQFVYDNGHRLTNYKRGPTGSPVIQNTYTYDGLGNRTNANLNGVNTTYSHNNINQLTNSDNGSQNINFTYDNNGNLTYDGIFYKTYDAEGRLLKDSSGVSNVITYQYDAFGRRVQKNINGNSYKYSYSGLEQIEERNGNTNNLLNRTVFNNFLSPVLNEKNNTPYYYHQNELNSVEAITDGAGNLTERYQYDVYGKPAIYDASNNLISSSIAGNRIGFTGQEYDSSNGNYRFYFRNYSPATGTFGQRDPMGYADGMGMYQYVHDNPANGIDIFGLEDCPKKNQPMNSWDWEGEYSNLTSILQYMSWASSHLNHPYIGAIWMIPNIRNTLVSIRDYDMTANSVAQNADGFINIVSNSATTTVGAIGTSTFLGGAFLKSISSDAVGVLSKSAFKQAVFKAGTASAEKYLGAAALRASPILSSVVSSAAVLGAYNLLGLAIQGGTHGEANSLFSFFDMISKKAGTNSVSTLNSSEYDMFKHYQWLDEYENEYYDKLGKKKNHWLQKFFDAIDKHPDPRCPQNPPPPSGTQKKPVFKSFLDWLMHFLQSRDPNAIIGPDGVSTQHWVSVHDRLPYTILYENDKSASAPAKFVRITSPIEPKEDASTFQLGSFGFNNQTFAVPPNTASYYQRLDCRDSLGLYVDVTAGYDQIANQAFWEFQSIDPVTLLPPADPLKGFLLLQDSSKGNLGHAFTNFNIKPKQTDITLDTIGARAAIIFDTNDTIPTNIAKNTIDAFAPTSHMSAVTSPAPNTVALSWTGVDDAGGCGIDHYTIYFSNDHVNFNVLIPKISRNDTTIKLPPDTSYCFFVLATDRVGNAEMLRQGEIQCFSFGQPVPITWLYFRGKTVAKDNILEWATANEQNSKQFDVERSLNGISFSRIGIVNAAGNSSQTSTYQYKDPSIDRLNSNVMFYRLKQIDINGNFKYSNIVKLSYNAQHTANSIVYPNPTQGLITILVGDNSLIGTTAIIYDINGRKVETIKITANSQSVSLGNYVNGTYFIKLSNDEVLKIEKL